jgi:hypothetical protein
MLREVETVTVAIMLGCLVILGLGTVVAALW